MAGCFLGVSWVFSVYPGCGCCVVEGKLVPDGFSWTIGSYPVQTWECCRGKIVRVRDLTQQPSTKTTATFATIIMTTHTITTSTTIMTTQTTTTSTTTSTTTAASTIGPCPPSWYKLGSSCYLYDDNYVTWRQAEDICQKAHQAHLVAIETQEENDFVWKDIGENV